MAIEQSLNTIQKSDLLAKVEEASKSGHRLVQIGVTRVGDNLEINYSFDKNLVFVNYRLTVAIGEEVPSISNIYWNAFIYENEIHDLFGIPVKGINIDFGGQFYRMAVNTPFIQEPSAAK